MTKQKGFSLIELLIVVAIILIIAAIAIPNLLRARMAANESSAASAIRAITAAETGVLQRLSDHRLCHPTSGSGADGTLHARARHTLACWTTLWPLLFPEAAATVVISFWPLESTWEGSINGAFVAGTTPISATCRERATSALSRTGHPAQPTQHWRATAEHAWMQCQSFRHPA